jgi:hypothetical protein
VSSVIYVVVAIRVDKRERSDSRSWAWFSSYEEAEKSLHRNTDWYCESGYYKWLLIETVHEGNPYQGDLVEHQKWFKADYNADSREYTITSLAEAPESLRNSVCWSIG